MTDPNTADSGGSDQPRNHIDLNDPASIEHWAKELGLATEVLRDAVQAAGPDAGDVSEYLTRKSVEGQQPTS